MVNRMDLSSNKRMTASDFSEDMPPEREFACHPSFGDSRPPGSSLVSNIPKQSRGEDLCTETMVCWAVSQFVASNRSCSGGRQQRNINP